MQAIMVEDEYSDIVLHHPYEIEKVYCYTHIKLKNSPRLYDSGCFAIVHHGKKISHREAYRQYKIQIVKDKLGMK